MGIYYFKQVILNQFSTCIWIWITEKLFGCVFDSECPNITQMWQILNDYVYPVITNIRLWFFCPIANYWCMTLPFIMCSTFMQCMWAWLLFLSAPTIFVWLVGGGFASPQPTPPHLFPLLDTNCEEIIIKPMFVYLFVNWLSKW